MAIPFEILHLPWQCGEQVYDVSCHGAPCIAFTSSIVRVVEEARGNDLPAVVRRPDGWGVYLLPSVGTSADLGPAHEEMTLIAYDTKGGQSRLTLHLHDAVPRPIHRDINEAAGQPTDDEWQTASIKTEELIDHHINLINQLYDTTLRSAHGVWQGLAEGLAVRPCKACLDKWRRFGGRDEPRMALIVSLERNARLRRLLDSVCARPRVILTRKRHMMPVGRVQEMDAACIRWIVRQPGMTVAQKAGSRQEVLSVRRYEHADTLENRVVRDLIRLMTRACNRYLRQNLRFGEHSRIIKIRRFRQYLKNMISDSPIASVSSITGLPSPNYVLQQDARYRYLWQTYLRLIRHEQAQDNAWQWQKRVWSEHLLLAVTSCINQLASDILMDSCDFAIRSEQVLGSYIDPRTVAGNWHIASLSGRRVEMAPAAVIPAHPHLPPWVAQSGADIALLSYQDSAQPRDILVIWAVYDFDLSCGDLQHRVTSLAEYLSQRQQSNQRIRGLIIQPAHKDSQTISAPHGYHHLCQGIAIQTQTQLDHKIVSQAIAEGLGYALSERA